MQFVPYLSFDGNAKDAIEFYAQVFGTEVTMLSTFGEMPGDESWVNDTNKDRIAHARINVGGSMVMVSDSAGFEPFEGHKGMSINVLVADAEEGHALFDQLAAGGQSRMPFEPTFWSKGFGVVVDKFGVTWMINVEEV